MELFIRRVLASVFLLVIMTPPASGLPGEGENVTCLSHWQEEGARVDAIVVRGDYAYIMADGFKVLDISDPDAPELVGSTGSGIAKSIALDGDLAFTNYIDLTIFDISDPTHPIILSTIPTDWYGDMAIEGDFLYLAGGLWGDFYIYSIIDPSLPVLISHTQVGPDTWDVVVRDGYAFIVTYYGVKAYDVSNPLDLVHLWSIPSIFAWDIKLKDDFLYIPTLGHYPDDAKLWIIDIADPEAPEVIVEFVSSNSLHRVDVAEDFAYLVGENEFLELLDVSNPAAPTYAGLFEAADVVKDVAAADNLFFVAAGYDGFWIVRNDLITTAAGEQPAAPVAGRLAPNYPNPFNPRTTFEFDLQRAGHALLTIHDITGRLVACLHEGDLEAGPHSVIWDGRDTNNIALPTGVYLAKLSTESTSVTRKVTLLR